MLNASLVGLIAAKINDVIFKIISAGAVFDSVHFIVVVIGDIRVYLSEFR